MRLLTLNLRQGGGRRAPALLDTLLRHDADALVLTEARDNPAGRYLAEQLRSAGYAWQAASAPAPSRNRVLVAARRPFRPTRLRTLALDPARLLHVRFAGLSLVGVHLPNLAAKRPHWAALLRMAATRGNGARVLLGDFNTGIDGEDAEGYRFTCAGEMRALLARGWVDAWRALHPDGRDYTWYSHRARGFRLDHALLSPACAPLLRGAAIDHTPREAGATDHAALRVELAP